MRWHDDEISRISSREQLADYLRLLAQRVRDNEESVRGAATAEYIDAAGRWTASMDAYFSNVLQEGVPEQPDWSLVAAIFAAAVVYE